MAYDAIGGICSRSEAWTLARDSQLGHDWDFTHARGRLSACISLAALARPYPLRGAPIIPHGSRKPTPITLLRSDYLLPHFSSSTAAAFRQRWPVGWKAAHSLQLLPRRASLDAASTRARVNLQSGRSMQSNAHTPVSITVDMEP